MKNLYISGTKIKGDIYNYLRLTSKRPSIDRHFKIERIEERAYDILKEYKNDEVGVHSKDHKIFAEYINTFAQSEKEDLLNKLQTEATFDVRKYLEYKSRTWWQKMFNITPKTTKTVSAKKLQKKIKSYGKIKAELSHGWFHKSSLYEKAQHLQNEAKLYVDEFLNDNLSFTAEDVPTMLKYFKELGEHYEGSPATEAVNKLQEFKPTETEIVVEKPAKKPLFATFLSNIRNRFANFKSQTDELKNKFGEIKNQADKMKNNLGERASKIKLKPATISTNSALRVAKITGLGLALTSLVMLGFNSDKSKNDKKINKVEQKAKVKQNNFDNTKTYTLQAKTDTLTPVFAVQKADTVNKKEQKLTAEQKMWQNFYNTKNEIIASKLKLDTHQIATAIASQISAGIFQMPKEAQIATENSETTAKERYAKLLYTHLIYKAYGLTSPLDALLNNTQKATAEQQAELENAVKTAGENGLGVKKIAQAQAKKHNRKLGHNSAYKSASKNLQKQYVNNLKIYKSMKQRGA